MKKSLAKNAFYKLILNIFNLLVPLFVGPYIARLLDKDLYGMYTRVYNEFSLFLTFAAFGIYSYGVREMSKVRDDQKKMNQMFTTLFSISVISNLVIMVVYIVYFTMRSDGLDTYIYALMLIQIIGNIFYIEFINEAIENYGFITKKTIIVRIFYLISIFLFVRKPSDVIIYTLVICATNFANNFISFVYLKKSIHFDFSDLQIPKHIIPLFVALLLTNVEILYATADKLMLGWYFSPSQALSDIEANRYAIPTTLVGMVCTIPLSLINVAIPRLSMHVGKGEKQEYERVLRSTSDTFMAMLIPMSFGMMVLAQEIIFVYSGEKWIDSYTVLIMACIIRLAYGFQSITSHLIMYANSLEKALVFFFGIFGVVNVASNFVLLYFGIMNSENLVATTGISTALYVFVAYRYSKRVLNLNYSLFSKQILGYLLISLCFIPISMIVHAFHLNPYLNIVIIMPICIGIYGFYLYVKKDPIISLVLSKIKLDKIINKLKRS